tara:strand:+ start:1188 stop:1442 length:255 start_codon:yes stop_codon:yes gene_type:complete
MFNRKTQNIEKIRNLKLLISNKYKLSDNTIISIAELSCHEPDCPPIETVITVRYKNGSMKNWRVAKPISEVEETDIYELEEHSH